MAEYAATTTVPVEKTKTDIERLVCKKYKADGYGVLSDRREHVIAFRIGGVHVRFIFFTPALQDYEFTPTGKRRTGQQQWNAWAQAERTLWRGVLDIIGAKFVSVEKGIRTLEQEFFGDIVIPNNQTMYQWGKPYLQASIAEGKMPPLLPGQSGE